MCANPAKFQKMFLGCKIDNFLCLSIDGQKIKQSDHVKLSGVEIDSKLNFDTHDKELCQKTVCVFENKATP